MLVFTFDNRLLVMFLITRDNEEVETCWYRGKRSGLNARGSTWIQAPGFIWEWQEELKLERGASICRRKWKSLLWVRDSKDPECVGLRPVPQGWLIPCQKGTKRLQKPIMEVWGKGPLGCHCGRFPPSSSESGNTGWWPGALRKEAGLEGCLTWAGKE